MGLSAATGGRKGVPPPLRPGPVYCPAPRCDKRLGDAVGAWTGDAAWEVICPRCHKTVRVSAAGVTIAAD